MTIDPKARKQPDFGKRPGAASSQAVKPEPGQTLGDRVNRFFRGLVTGKVVPKVDAKRRKGGNA